jgi:hypothetical protein
MGRSHWRLLSLSSRELYIDRFRLYLAAMQAAGDERPLVCSSQVVHEASHHKFCQLRQGCAATSFGQEGHFASRSRLLRLISFLHAREPHPRIFFNLSTTLHVDLTLSGFIPGGILGSRCIEVQQQWWTRTRLVPVLS